MVSIENPNYGNKLDLPSKICEGGIMQVAHDAQRLGLLCIVDVHRILRCDGVDDAIRKVKDWRRTTQRCWCNRAIFRPGRG